MSLLLTKAHRPIITLLFGRGPSAIVFVIALIVVFSIKGVSDWTRPHVVKEVSEFVPPFADRDASSTVTSKILSLRPSAAIAHRGPTVVLGCFFVCLGVAVFRDDVLIQATTTARITARQAKCQNKGLFTTFTATTPDNASGSAAPFGFGNHCKATKNLADQLLVSPVQMSAAFDSAVDKVICPGDVFCSAGTLTAPHGHVVLFTGWFNDVQFAKHLPGEIGTSSAYCRYSHAGSSIQGMRVVRGWRSFPRPSASLTIAHAHA